MAPFDPARPSPISGFVARLAWSPQDQPVNAPRISGAEEAQITYPPVVSDDATNIRVLLVEKAWQEGYAAGEQGLTLDANPYHIGTAEAQAWQYGFLDGRFQRPA